MLKLSPLLHAQDNPFHSTFSSSLNFTFYFVPNLPLLPGRAGIDW